LTWWAVIVSYGGFSGRLPDPWLGSLRNASTRAGLPPAAGVDRDPRSTTACRISATLAPFCVAPFGWAFVLTGAEPYRMPYITGPLSAAANILGNGSPRKICMGIFVFVRKVWNSVGRIPRGSPSSLTAFEGMPASLLTSLSVGIVPFQA